MLKVFFNRRSILSYCLTITGLLLLVTIVMSSESPKEIHTEHYKDRFIVVYRDKPDKFTKEKLVQYLKDLNIKFPEVVYAQAVIESGNFTSKKFIEDNNLFGMRKAKSRCTLAFGTGTYAKFKTWRESVIDYALYQTAFAKKYRTRAEYVNHLARNYATSGNYSEHLLHVIEEVKENF